MYRLRGTHIHNAYIHWHETNAQDNISIIFYIFFFVIQLQKQQTAAAAAPPTATTTKHKTSKIDTTKSNEILWLL